MHSVYIGLGSNLGRRGDNIRRALDLLTQDGSRLAAVSSFHETTPVGFTSNHSFLNAAALVLTPLPPEAFLDATQRVERALGRTVKSENGIYHDRTIDIDMLFYDDIVLNTPRLTIPHPHMCGRAFVLAPLCEIAPAMVHPVNCMTVAQMLAALQNNSTAGSVKP